MNNHRRKILSRWGGLLLLAGMSSSLLAAETLTYKDLVQRLTDMEQIAVLPTLGEKGALASSWSRSSTYDHNQDRYEAWDANVDGSGVIRMEGDKEVLADIQGPGCIWRTWSATVDKGHVKIYLDGAESPVVDLPFSGYFDRKNEPFTRPNLVYKTSAQGYNNYTPIPFQKSCKIVADKGWGAFYHFNYTQFPAETVVPTFKLPLSAEDLATLDAANKTLGQCGQDPAGTRPEQKMETKSVSVPAGGKAEVIALKGTQAITGLRVKMDLPKDVEAQRNLLAQLTVSMTWDGEKKPAVWSPLGDFFASAAGAVPFQTLPVGMLPDGTFYCYWYMPFEKGARIEVGNDSDRTVVMSWEIAHTPLDKRVQNMGRFHAKWHRDAFLPRKDRAMDWTLLTTQGAGRYVGTQLHVWNPRGDWWGEGDEKFFVDGEKFPSTFGTGSEDYFGYAWSSGTTFVQALHSQPVNENNQGHVSVNRWHIADNIPFRKSFEGALEKYFLNDRPTLFSAVAFWYLKPGGTDPYPASPVSERVGWWVRPKIFKAENAIENEDLHNISQFYLCGIGTWKQFPGVFSGDTYREWRGRAVGDKIALEVPVKKAGKYRIQVCSTKGPDNGICQLMVNGQKLGQLRDGYAKKLSSSGPVEIGTLDLPQGKAILGVEITGRNEASAGLYFGIDYVRLIPVE